MSRAPEIMAESEKKFRKHDRHSRPVEETVKHLSNSLFYKSIANVPDTHVEFMKSIFGSEVPPDNPFLELSDFEKPLAAAIPDYVWRKGLAVNWWNNPICGNPLCKDKDSFLKFKRCSKCLLEAYCSQTCQKADWKRHKPLCCNLKRPLEGDPYAPVVCKLKDTDKPGVKVVDKDAANGGVYAPPGWG